MRRKILGIDPGKTGALVLLDENCKIQFKSIIPLIGGQVDVHQIDDYIKSIKTTYSDDLHVVLEDVHSVFGASAKANYVFGWINGILEAIIVANKISYEKVAPKKWQSVVWEGIRPITINTGKKTKTGEVKLKVDTKNTTLIAIKRLFPNDDFTKSERAKKDADGLIDACALAYYGYIKNY